MSVKPIIFTAAGSGGHIFAAIATLKAFVREYPTLASSVLFVGSTLTMEGEKRQLPMEERICQRLGIPFLKIRMGKLQRQLSLNSFKLAAKVVLGFWDAWKLIRKERPSVIAAFGGYVSLPLVLVGRMFGAKIVLHEQTSNIGLTNKILQRFAQFIGVTYDTSTPYFSVPVTVVGSPTMKHIYTIESFEHLLGYLHKEKSRLLEEPLYLESLQQVLEGKKRRPFILISGGSQGSHFLNEQIRAIMPQLLRHYTVYLQTGENEIYNDYNVMCDYVASLPADLSHHAIIRKFIHEEYGYLLQNADVFIGRSGANTVYQVGMNHTKAIFLPISWVTRNEQYTNAVILRDAGMALILDEKSVTPKDIISAIEQQLAHTQGSDSKDAVNRIFPQDADSRMAKEIAKLAV